MRKISPIMVEEYQGPEKLVGLLNQIVNRYVRTLFLCLVKFLCAQVSCKVRNRRTWENIMECTSNSRILIMEYVVRWDSGS